MKKSLVVLLLAVSIILTGCKSNDVTKGNNRILETESSSSKSSNKQNNKTAISTEEAVGGIDSISENKDGLLFGDSNYHKVKLLFDMNIRSMPSEESQVVYMASAGTILYLSNVSKIANGFGGATKETKINTQINRFSAVFDKNGVLLGFMGANRLDMTKIYVEDLKEENSSLVEQAPTVKPTESASVKLAKTTKNTPYFLPRNAGGVSEASPFTIPLNTEVYVTFDDIFATSKNNVPVCAFITKTGELVYLERNTLEILN